EGLQVFIQVIDAFDVVEIDGEDVNGDEVLAHVLGVGGKDIELFDLAVRDGDTAGGNAAAVDVDVLPGLQRVAENAVGGIGIVEPEGKMILASRVELIDVIESLRYLVVPCKAFGPEGAGHRTNLVGLEEPVFLFPCILYPDLELAIVFEA